MKGLRKKSAPPPPPPPEEDDGSVISGFVVKLYEMVQQADGDIIDVSQIVACFQKNMVVV